MRSPAAIVCLVLLAGLGLPAARSGAVEGSMEFRREMIEAAKAALPEGGLLAAEGRVPRPQRVRGRLPGYPMGAQRQGIPGSVALLALINEEGAVASLQTLGCTRLEHGFEEAAHRAVSEWVYAPPIHRGRPAAVHLVIMVEFSPEGFLLQQRREAMEANLRILAREQIYPAGAHIAGEDGVSWPVPVKQSGAAYPRSARLRRVEARVVLLTHIGEDGKVLEILLAHAENLDHPFEEAARRAVLQWQFKPALLAGSPVAAYHWVRVDFDAPRGR